MLLSFWHTVAPIDDGICKFMSPYFIGHLLFGVVFLIASISKERTSASGQLFSNNYPEFFSPDKSIVNMPIRRGFPY